MGVGAVMNELSGLWQGEMTASAISYQLPRGMTRGLQQPAHDSQPSDPFYISVLLLSPTSANGEGTTMSAIITITHRIVVATSSSSLSLSVSHLLTISRRPYPRNSLHRDTHTTEPKVRTLRPARGQEQDGQCTFFAGSIPPDQSWPIRRPALRRALPR